MRKFWLDSLIATLFVFVVLWLLVRITQLNILNSLDPLSQALEDMELTDYAFTQLRWEEPEIDTSIVLINTSTLSRAKIAEQIMNIKQFDPKIIALDIIFSCDGGATDSVNCPQAYDTFSNLLLANAIAEANNVVMAHKLWQSNKLIEEEGNVDVYDSLEHTDEIIRGNSMEGFVNLTTNANHQEDLKICREFQPQMEVNGVQELAFGTKIAYLYDSATTKKFLERDNVEEVINYRGNIVDWHGASEYPGRYIVLDWEQALNPEAFTPELIKDKIVIMGFLGADLRDTSWDDKFFTPMNNKFAGRARPDMYGVVIHANIVSMILKEDYIDVLPEWMTFTISFFLCFIVISLFAWIFKVAPLWFDTITISFQLVAVVMLAILGPFLFYWFDLKVEVTTALAALALAGPCFEIYITIIKRGIFLVTKRLGFTKEAHQVLSKEH